MAIINVLGSVEYNLPGVQPVTPVTILIATSDSLASVMATGYLNGSDVIFGVTYTDTILAAVTTTDGLAWLAVSIVGSDISLVWPGTKPPVINQLVTAPPASSSGTAVAFGTAWHNTFGYDVMLTVYVNITSAATASIFLGVGPTSTPTQQTIATPLSFSVLSVIPIPVYVPAGYYALLTTTGTISMSVSGQIVMPV